MEGIGKDRVERLAIWNHYVFRQRTTRLLNYFGVVYVKRAATPEACLDGVGNKTCMYNTGKEW